MKRVFLAVLGLIILAAFVVVEISTRQWWEEIKQADPGLQLIADLGGVRVYEDRMGGAIVEIDR